KIDTMMPWSSIPDNDLSADMQGKITHASLQLEDGGSLAGNDMSPTRYTAPVGFAVILNFKGVDRAQRIFDGLAEGGTITMPLAETFWTARFGMVTDRFG